MLSKIKEKIFFENIDKTILASSALIILFGVFSFFSASIGFLNKVENEEFFSSFIKTQLLAYLIGASLFFIVYFLSTKFFIRISTYLYVFSILLCLLIFIPGIEIQHGGGVRWLNLFGFSLQPADILKFACIVLYSSYFYKYRSVLSQFKFAVIYPAVIMIPVAVVFFLQKDLGSLTIIFFVVAGVYILNNIKVSYILLISLLGIMIVFSYAMLNKYVMDRVNGMKVESYQAKQSLIALGSGGLFGRGYGKSVQKFFYLPEPAGDSIFAVVGEEFGFVGTSLVAFLFLIMILKSIFIARKSDNPFVRNMLYGISFLFFAQFVMNTGSMTKIIPLSGDTLPFFSKGGTALIMNMIELSLLLKFTRKDIIRKT